MRYFLMKMYSVTVLQATALPFLSQYRASNKLPAFVTCIFCQLRNSDRKYEPLSPGYTLRHVTVNKRNDRRFTPARDKNLLICQV